MTIQFDIWTWKDIQNVVGTVISFDEAREMLHYIRLRCQDNKFEAVASNGFQLSRLNGKCKMSEYGPVDLHISPMKAPAKTAQVNLTVDPNGENHVLYFFDKKGEMTGFETMTVAKGEMPDFDSKFIQPAIDNMARQQYRIGVNPKYLINALSGMKEQETVILEFGTDVQPFLIHPYKKEDLDALSIVLPVRTFGN